MNKELSPLTGKLLNFQETGEGFEKLVQDISIEIFRILQTKYYMDEDERSDFLCQFYPKIPGLINRFNYTGIPFDAYLNVSLKWSLKTFSTEKSRRKRIERLLLDESFNISINRTAFEEDNGNTAIPSRVARKALRMDSSKNDLSEAYRRRLLFLYLIEAEFLKESIKESISSITGYERDVLDKWEKLLKDKVSIRLKRISELRDKRNSLFFQIYLAQDCLGSTENSEEHESIENRIRILRKRIRKCEQKMDKISSRPTHRDVADILNIPKGSVDSGIYYLKNAIRRAEETESKSA